MLEGWYKPNSHHVSEANDVIKFLPVLEEILPATTKLVLALPEWDHAPFNSYKWRAVSVIKDVWAYTLQLAEKWYCCLHDNKHIMQNWMKL